MFPTLARLFRDRSRIDLEGLPRPYGRYDLDLAYNRFFRDQARLPGFLAPDRVLPTGEVLAVVLEMATPGGLDTLAAGRDGSVEFIEHSTGAMPASDVSESVKAIAARLVARAEADLGGLPMWIGKRRAPPAPGCGRITLVTTRGPIVGEDSFEVLQSETRIAGTIQIASLLLEEMSASSNDVPPGAPSFRI